MKNLILIALIFLSLAWGQEKSILVTYFSRGGNTKEMAKAVAEGARELESISVYVKQVAKVSNEDLLMADAIIVGSPVYNGNVAPQVQEFINSWPFKNSPMKDKIGAAFTTGGGISAGEELVQLNILHSMLIYGMVVAGGPDWETAFGASAITEEKPFLHEPGKVNEIFLEKGRKLGRRIAELTLKINKD